MAKRNSATPVTPEAQAKADAEKDMAKAEAPKAEAPAKNANIALLHDTAAKVASLETVMAQCVTLLQQLASTGASTPAPAKAKSGKAKGKAKAAKPKVSDEERRAKFEARAKERIAANPPSNAARYVCECGGWGIYDTFKHKHETVRKHKVTAIGS